MWRISNTKLFDVFISIVVMMLTTLIGMAFREMNILEANISMIYILGVVVIARYARTKWGGILGSILGVTMFNYFFTAPYYSLRAESKEYPVTFLIMFMVAISTSTLTEKLKKRLPILKKEKHLHKSYIKPVVIC